MRSKCFDKELPPLSNFIQTKKIFCWARKGLGTSLALQGYAGFVSSGFPSKIAKDRRDQMRRQTQTVHPFRSFIYSFPTQLDCVLPVTKLSQCHICSEHFEKESFKSCSYLDLCPGRKRIKTPVERRRCPDSISPSAKEKQKACKWTSDK